jgi:polyisoprenoid-binding protein YceI
MLTHGRRTARVLVASVAAATLLAGCLASHVETPGPRGPKTSAAAPVPPGARAYDIDPARSIVTLLVYRAGPLARLGHNHAVTVANETGVVWVSTALESSGFEIHVPVAALVVDDPQARAAAGTEFPGSVPDAARSGTTTNMLRAEVLDAEHYPEVVVRSTRSTGTWQRAMCHVTVRLKDIEREYEVPVTLAVAGDSVTASGALQLRQTDFGITPFSVAGGAIQVADTVDLRFHIVAQSRP